MVSSKKSQKLLKGKNLFCNFLGMDIGLGDILVLDKQNHSIYGNIKDFIPGLELEKLIKKGPEMELSFQSEAKIGIEFAGNARGQMIKADEVSIKFNSNKTTFINLSGLSHQVLPIGSFEESLRNFWNEKGFNQGSYKRRCQLVTSIIRAESGILIYSKDSNNIIRLKSTTGSKLLTNSDLVSGNLDISNSKKEILHIKSNDPFSPMYGTQKMDGKGRFVAA
jgi:hypothetical protein